MNSSTSSSKPATAGWRSSPEWKVILVLALMLLGSEIFLRVIERHLSIDVAHIRAAPALAASIRQGEDLPAGTLKVLFIGNSSIRRGLLPETLVTEFESRFGQKIRPYFFYPDGGTILAWRWGWRRYFESPDCRPDLVVICGGASHFDDGVIDPRVAASYFVSAKDMGAFLMDDLETTEKRLEFVVAKASLSYASRRRVQRRLMDFVMPYNREVLFDIVASTEAKEARKKALRTSQPTSESLSSLLEEIHGRGLKALVVAVPNLTSYDVPAERVKIIEASGASFADHRTVPGIGPELFYDRAHLDQEGAEIFTRALCSSLHEALPPRRAP